MYFDFQKFIVPLTESDELSFVYKSEFEFDFFFQQTFNNNM